jgi:glycerol-3-phosphate cytidylyltransferase-like family protein
MKTVVIMPGGFHPFHAGHASLYQSALEAFPNADVYVAATNDTKTRPFPFEIKEKLAKVAGVAPGRFVQVKSPFQAKEILQNYDPEQDVVVFVRSEKDRDEQPKPGGTKKDGSPAYFQPYTGKNLQPFGKHGYIAYLPTVEFGPGIKSATEIRNAWPKLNDRRKLAMVMSLYPKAQENQRLAMNIVKMLDIGMGNEEPVSEDKSGVEQAYDDPETHSIMAYARQHYPEEPDLQAAFVKFVLRSLNHSKEDDERQDNEIELLMKRVNSLHDTVNKLKDDAAQQSEKVDESAFDWSDYRFVEDMDTRLKIVESFFSTGAYLKESNDPDMSSYFESLSSMSDAVSVGKKCILVSLVMINNKVNQIQFPEVVTLLKIDNGTYTVKRPSGVTDIYPKTRNSGNAVFITLVFNKVASYDKLRTTLMLKFESPLPDPDLFIKSNADAQKTAKLDEGQDYLDEK